MRRCRPCRFFIGAPAIRHSRSRAPKGCVGEVLSKINLWLKRDAEQRSCHYCKSWFWQGKGAGATPAAWQNAPYLACAKPPTLTACGAGISYRQVARANLLLFAAKALRISRVDDPALCHDMQFIGNHFGKFEVLLDEKDGDASLP